MELADAIYTELQHLMESNNTYYYCYESHDECTSGDKYRLETDQSDITMHHKILAYHIHGHNDAPKRNYSVDQVLPSNHLDNYAVAA